MNEERYIDTIQGIRIRKRSDHKTYPSISRIPIAYDCQHFDTKGFWITKKGKDYIKKESAKQNKAILRARR